MDDKIFVKANGFFLRVIKIVGDDIVCKIPSYRFKYAVFAEDYDQPKHKLIVDGTEYTDVSKEGIHTCMALYFIWLFTKTKRLN